MLDKSERKQISKVCWQLNWGFAKSNMKYWDTHTNRSRPSIRQEDIQGPYQHLHSTQSLTPSVCLNMHPSNTCIFHVWSSGLTV